MGETYDFEYTPHRLACVWRSAMDNSSCGYRFVSSEHVICGHAPLST